MQTRRHFLTLLGKGVVTASCVPLLQSCSKSAWDRRLPFGGEVLGEELALCHGVRDRSIDFHSPPPTGKLHDVIIIGGGVSGITAAWKLVKSGVTDLLVLDKAEELGGTCIAGEENGIRFSWGAHYVETPQPTAKHLCEIYEDVGVIQGYRDGAPLIHPDYIVPEPDAALLAGRQWGQARVPLQIADSQDRVEYETFRRELYRWAKWRDEAGRPAFCYPIEASSPAEEVRRLDDISMLDHVRSLGMRSKLLDWHIDDRVADEYGCRMADVSAYAGILLWAQSNASFRDYEPPGTRIEQNLSWPEGLAFLVNGLAKALRPRQIRCDTLAVNVQNTNGEVLVTTVSGTDRSTQTLRAKHVVYAAPKNGVYHTIPDLAAAERLEFKQCQYTPWIVANVHLRDCPRGLAWENLRHGGWGAGYINARHMVDRGRPGEGPTVLTFYAPLCANRTIERHELLREGWQFWARQVLHELEHMHPGIDRFISKLDVWKWGHGMIAPTPGYIWGQARAKMKQPFGQIHFAHADVAGVPVFEQTSFRGVEVAQEVMDALGVPYRSSI